MYRVLIWGLGYEYERLVNLIKYQEYLGNISVVGITDQNEIYRCLDGYSFIPVKDIKVEKIDYIIVTTEQYFMEIAKDAWSIGFFKGQLINGKVFFIPGFDLKKYIALINKRISIISNNCWGGVVYHTLGMEFRSPFVNMFLHDEDYLKLLKNFSYYMDQRLQFDRYEYETVLKRNYPVCKLRDIELHFNHYVEMADVEEKWYSRCKRMNIENLFIMMFTEKQDIAERFTLLDFSKKICFVPFESTYKTLYTLRPNSIAEKEGPFWRIVMRQLMFRDYDIIELLLNGDLNRKRILYQKENSSIC